MNFELWTVSCDPWLTLYIDLSANSEPWTRELWIANHELRIFELLAINSELLILNQWTCES